MDYSILFNIRIPSHFSTPLFLHQQDAVSMLFKKIQIEVFFQKIIPNHKVGEKLDHVLY